MPDRPALDIMDFLKTNILTLIIFTPLAGALLVVIANRVFGASEETLRRISLLVSLVTLFLAGLMAVWFNRALTGYQMEVRAPWLTALDLGVSYHVGVDGLSLWLMVLTAALTPLALLGSWKEISRHIPEYLVVMLLLESGMLGVFVALDMFLFYLFWEAMLIPMYFLIGIWGSEQRIYAAIKFVLYTIAGSLLMLVAIIGLYLLNHEATGVYTFDLVTITQNIADGQLRLASQTEMWCFAAFALAFLIKVPSFPFHTWLPDAHVEAPTAGSVILAGVLLKMGTYGLIRFNLPLFPDATAKFAPYIAALAVISIVYGALVAMVQPNLKKLIAYSSVSHLGFCVLGIFALTTAGLQGSLYQMLSHGVSTGALFLLVGMIYERRHTKEISDFGGFASSIPAYSTVFLIVTLASIGLPILCGFVGEFLVLLGTFTSGTLPHARIYAGLAATGMIWSAVYMLWMYQRVFAGETTNEKNRHVPDLNLREKFVLVPLVALAVFMGVLPNMLLSRSEGTMVRIAQAASRSQVFEQSPPAGTNGEVR